MRDRSGNLRALWVSIAAGITRAATRAAEHSEKAGSMRGRADGSRAAADRAIYSDDPTSWSARGRDGSARNVALDPDVARY